MSGRTIFQLGYEVSPIILTQGIASAIPGQMLPIIAITQAANLALGVTTNGQIDINPDDFFARFQPVSGGTLIENQIGQYPFANQIVAANAIIAQPINVSIEMICPARAQGAYISKLVTMTALKMILDQHIAMGGTFIVATPAQIYVNCLLLRLKDVTPSDLKQKQAVWQWDFYKPLITESAAISVANSKMGSLANGFPQTPQ